MLILLYFYLWGKSSGGMKMNEEKIAKSFKLVKEDIRDLYSKIAEISDKTEEVRVSVLSLADKIGGRSKKAVKKKIRKKK